MRIQSSQLKGFSPQYKSLAKAHQQNEAATTQEAPADKVTFSNDVKRAVLPIVGMGVAMTGMMAGAQASNPVLMLGSMFGGMAIMVAGIAS